MTGRYTWLPDMKKAGQMVLAAVLYDANGDFGRYRHTGATGGAAKGRTGRNNRGTGATGRRYSKAGP